MLQTKCLKLVRRTKWSSHEKCLALNPMRTPATVSKFIHTDSINITLLHSLAPFLGGARTFLWHIKQSPFRASMSTSDHHRPFSIGKRTKRRLCAWKYVRTLSRTFLYIFSDGCLHKHILLRFTSNRPICDAPFPYSLLYLFWRSTHNRNSLNLFLLPIH